MVIGYSISGPDNDSYLNYSLYGKNICQCLYFVRNREQFISQDFKVKKAHYDYSCTYDGGIIVSQKFKDFCELGSFQGVEFYPLVQQNGLFLLKLKNTVNFDSKRRKTRFLEFNSECHEYNEVVGANPVCLEINKELKRGFYRTDLEFARGYAKHPLVIVGTETYESLKNLKLKGIHGEKILDSYSWEKE